MALQAIHDKLEDIPEQYQELYTEKNEKFELTGIIGVKTQADVDRLQNSLHKSQQDNKDIKAKFAPWGDMDHAETMALLDRIPELETAAAGKMDDAAIQEAVDRRVEGTKASLMAPMERQKKADAETIATLTAENATLRGEKTTRTIHDQVRTQLTKHKVISAAHEDALALADRVLEIREDDGEIVTKENSGFTPGANVDMWLSEIDSENRRVHWWEASGGGGAAGGAASRGTGFANNPWSAGHWNMTQQGQVLTQHGREKADQMAKAAGTTVGGPRPAAKK